MGGGDLKPGGDAVDNIRRVFRIRQGAEEGRDQLFAGENAQMQQAVVNQRLRTQLLAAARLAAVADADDQRIALPVKVLPADLAAVRLQGIHAHQAVD